MCDVEEDKTLCYFTLRRAESVRRERGTNAIKMPKEMMQRVVRELFEVALVRLFSFLFSEALIVFGALYNGCLYGFNFLFNGVFGLVSGPEGHGFVSLVWA